MIEWVVEMNTVQRGWAGSRTKLGLSPGESLKYLDDGGYSKFKLCGMIEDVVYFPESVYKPHLNLFRPLGKNKYEGSEQTRRYTDSN